MSGRPEDCILRFWTQDKGSTPRAVVGTGFLLRGADGGYVAVTCAHVVNQVLGREQLAATDPRPVRLTMELFGRRQIEGELAAWCAPTPVKAAGDGRPADIAVLTVAPGLGLPTNPALNVLPPESVVPPGESVRFWSFGFMGQADGIRARGLLTVPDRGGWFVAEAERDTGRFIEGGLSGAPVFGPGNTILGMVAQYFEPAARQGRIVPAMMLARAWPKLARPYPGPVGFDAATAHLFFGRGRPLETWGEYEGKIAELRARLERQRIVAVVGASGSGKSSLVRAGLVPWFVRDGWSVLSFRPQQQPLVNFATAIAEAFHPEPGEHRIRSIQEWGARLGRGELHAALEGLRGGGAQGVLIAIDQFEEFFTGDSTRAEAIKADRDTLLPRLFESAGQEDVRLVLTVRLDLLGQMQRVDPTAQKMLTRPYEPELVGTMSAGEIMEAIERPAAVFGVSVNPRLAANLAADATRGEGRLPLLQIALAGLWPGILRSDQGWVLPFPVDARAADLEAALESWAEGAVANLQRELPGRPALDETAIRRALTSMVQLSGANAVATKRIVPLESLPRSEREVLERLAAPNARLVVIAGEEGCATAELVHEALMHWKRLEGWIAADRVMLRWLDRLRRQRAIWIEHERQDRYLLQEGERELAGWLEQRRETLAVEPDLLAYIAASRTYRARLSQENEKAQAEKAEQAAAYANALIQKAAAEESAAREAEARAAEASAAANRADRLRRDAETQRDAAVSARRRAFIGIALACLFAVVAGGGWIDAKLQKDGANRVRTLLSYITVTVTDISGLLPEETKLVLDESAALVRAGILGGDAAAMTVQAKVLLTMARNAYDNWNGLQAQSLLAKARENIDDLSSSGRNPWELLELRASMLELAGDLASNDEREFTQAIAEFREALRNLSLLSPRSRQDEIAELRIRRKITTLLARLGQTIGIKEELDSIDSGLGVGSDYPEERSAFQLSYVDAVGDRVLVQDQIDRLRRSVSFARSALAQAERDRRPTSALAVLNAEGLQRLGDLLGREGRDGTAELDDAERITVGVLEAYPNRTTARFLLELIEHDRALAGENRASQKGIANLSVDGVRMVQETFGSGLGRFHFEMTPEQVNQLLPTPFANVSFGSLPRADEYRSGEVRYLQLEKLNARDMNVVYQNVPCLERSSDLVFMFHRNRLFMISVRFLDERYPGVPATCPERSDFLSQLGNRFHMPVSISRNTRHFEWNAPSVSVEGVSAPDSVRIDLLHHVSAAS